MDIHVLAVLLFSTVLKSILICVWITDDEMIPLHLPSHLEDKIFEIRSENDGDISGIVSYFPFTESEKQEILSLMNKKQFDGFSSIFTDHVTEEEWNRTKEQIKKKFRDELFDVDKTS